MPVLSIRKDSLGCNRLTAQMSPFGSIIAMTNWESALLSAEMNTLFLRVLNIDRYAISALYPGVGDIADLLIGARRGAGRYRSQNLRLKIAVQNVSRVCSRRIAVRTHELEAVAELYSGGHRSGGKHSLIGAYRVDAPIARRAADRIA